MSKHEKPYLSFAYDGLAVALSVPLVEDENHTPHRRDGLTIELDPDTDEAIIFLEEVDEASGALLLNRVSRPIPMRMLADLVRRRPKGGKRPANWPKVKAVTAD